MRRQILILSKQRFGIALNYGDLSLLVKMLNKIHYKSRTVVVLLLNHRYLGSPEVQKRCLGVEKYQLGQTGSIQLRVDQVAPTNKYKQNTLIVGVYKSGLGFSFWVPEVIIGTYLGSYLFA